MDLARVVGMGNPLRFLGAGEPIEIDGVVIPPRCAVEVTFRTHQQQFQLRPDQDANEILLGCFGRAYARYPDLHAFVLSILSNHGSFVALPESAFALSWFMRDFLSTAARRLNGHRDRSGTFWERRYRAIPIADEAKLEERFAYALLQGTKENLVWSARDWPGVSSVRALMGGPQLVGRWRDGTTEGERRRQRARKLARAATRGRELELPEVEPVWIEYPIELEPLPHWRDLPVGQRRALVTKIVRDDEAQTRARHDRDGTRPLGVRAILETDPWSRPANPKKSPAPRVHASSRRVRRAFGKLYRAFAQALHEGTEALVTLMRQAAVPAAATVRPLTAATRDTAPLVTRGIRPLTAATRDTAPLVTRGIGPPA